MSARGSAPSLYKNVIFNMINKCIDTVELISVNSFAVISHYFSPFLHTATSLNYLGFGKPVLHFSVSSSALKRTDVLVIKKYDEGLKPNLEDLEFINWFVGFSSTRRVRGIVTIILHKDSNGNIQNVAF